MISTAGDAALTVADPSPAAPGKLVNGAFSLPPLRVARRLGVAAAGASSKLRTRAGQQRRR